MRALLLTLGVIALVAISAQLFRHLYVGWIAPTTSALDKYMDTTEKEINVAQSLEELVQQYEAATNKLREWEKTNQWHNNEIEADPKLRAKYYKEQNEVAAPVDKLRSAIRDWESRSREVFELHFFWWCGFACLACGLICFACGIRWFAIATKTLGFLEMIYWTSPTFRFLGGGLEFERLLFWKTVYTVGALGLLIGIWIVLSRSTRNDESGCAISGKG